MKAETHDGIFEVAPTLLSTAATTSRPPSIRGEDSPPFELGGPAHALSRDELSDFLFSGSHFEEHLDGTSFEQTPSSVSGKKRGRKLAPATGDKRREANRAAQRSFRERKVQHVKDLEARVHTYESHRRRASHIIHSLLNDNNQMRETLGRPPQSLGELLETGAVADRETSRRSSLAATSSGSFSIISPSKSPGSLPEDPSESPSPLVQPHSLPRSPTDAAVPPRCLPSAPTPLMAGQEMAQVPLLPQDYLMQHPTLRAPPPPPAGPCPQDGAPPASNFNQYANDYSQTHPGLWNQSMGALFQRFPDQRAGSRSDTPLQLQPFVTHQSQQIIQHPSHYQPAPTPQPPHPHPHQPQPIHPPHQHFLNTLDFYPSWPQQPGR